MSSTSCARPPSSSSGATASASGSLDAELPPPPDAGFFGRDETLLALDRAFDQNSIVLLHAYAGSGKTTTAAEFARWYSLTGGVDGPVLFTTFERYLPLPRVLDRIGQVFGEALGTGVHWLALDGAARRRVALQVLAQIPVLWIWDNVEPVAGFPSGTESAWSAKEQKELADFLRALRETKAVDPENEGPLPGREEEWSLVIEYRVLLAEKERQWAEAERLQTSHVNWDRQRAAPALARQPGELESGERNAIRTLAASLHELGEIRRELGRAECVPAYEEALDLSERIGERAGAATCAFNLGHAFMDLPALHNLNQAERWYQRSLELRDESDRLRRSRCVLQLGSVAYERFHEARSAKRPTEELLRHLNEAVRLCHEALDLLPADAVDDLAVTHNQLGAIYGAAGDLDRAVQHYRESIHYEESQGNLYGASQTRFNVPSHSAMPAAGKMLWSTPRRRCGDSRATGRGQRR